MTPRLNSAEETQYLQATITRMAGEMRRTKSSQAVLLQRLNELTSTFRSLPQDILADIFSYVCADRLSFLSPSRKIRYPLIQVITQVCSGWREAARASPSLWSEVLIQTTTREWAAIGTIGIIQLHIDNAGMLPLSITFDVESGQATLSPEYYSEEGRFVSCLDLHRFIFCQNPNKIGSVTLRTCPSGNSIWWLRSPASGISAQGDISDQVTYPNFVSLNVDWNSYWDDDSTCPLFQGASVPNLRHLFLRCNLSKIQIPFDNLATLHLSSATAQECFDMLEQYQGLTEFHANLISYPDRLRSTNRTITLNNLQTLAWNFDNFELGVAFMNYFRFPSLRTLFCHRARRDSYSPDFLPQDYEKQWTKFLTTLPALRRFGFSVSSLSNVAAETIHRALCQTDIILDELYLWDHIKDSWQIDFTGTGIFLRCLNLSNVSSDSKANTSASPSIKVKAIHLYEDLSRVWGGNTVDFLLDLVESRRALSCYDARRLEALVLHINTYFAAPVSVVDVMKKWTLDQCSRLDKLRVEGFQFRVEKGLSPNFIDSYRTCGCVG
jgi:hypothetical protein